MEQVGVRSYNVKTEDGRIFRGNRKFLRQTKEPFFADEEESIIFPRKEREAVARHEDRQSEMEQFDLQEAPH